MTTASSADADADASVTDGVVLVDESMQQPALSASIDEIRQLLKVMEHDVLPVTEKGVEQGNKVFGAAILNQDLTCQYANTNHETECPLYHGEVYVIMEWSKLVKPSERGPKAQSSVFLATHEPCCMCISSVLWSGFNKIYYFFPYTSTAAQGIPHDINTMHELWGVNTYRRRNKYFASACILDLVNAIPDDRQADKQEFQQTIDRITKAYDVLSQKYHTEKANNKDNSLVLG